MISPSGRVGFPAAGRRPLEMTTERHAGQAAITHRGFIGGTLASGAAVATARSAEAARRTRRRLPAEVLAKL
jgi:hypothetical protein